MREGSVKPAPLAHLRFTAPVIAWRGPSPFHFIVVPREHADELRWAAKQVSYGWGMVPAEVRIGAITFATALFARDDSYYIPLRDKVRREAGLAVGDAVPVDLKVWPVVA